MIIHAFRLSGRGGHNYLFLWINNFGLKFASCSFDEYQEAKKFIMDREWEKMRSEMVAHKLLHPVLDEIVEKIEEFSICPH